MPVTDSAYNSEPWLSLYDGLSFAQSQKKWGEFSN
jgi:hypothetical protein